MKIYLWQRKNGDRMFGFFHSIKAAGIAARNEARENGEVFEIEIWSTRPAKQSDAKLFNGVENDSGEICDTAKPGWFKGLCVPVNIVQRASVG
jgi:hypothetical protein